MFYEFIAMDKRASWYENITFTIIVPEARSAFKGHWVEEDHEKRNHCYPFARNKIWCTL